LAADANAPAVGPDHQLPPYDPPHHRRNLLWLIVAGLLLLLLLLAGIWIWHDHEEAKKKAAAAAKPPGIPVTTVTAQKGDIGVYLNSIGTVTPVYTDSITSQVNGLIVAVHYREGQQVAKGDPLVDIDVRPYQATLSQSQGTLERDVNVLAQARMDLSRYQTAWASNAIARQILEDQEKLVLQDEGTVKNDQGTVEFNQVQVDFCHITAPISGRMGLRLVDPGNVVQSSGTTTLAVITQIQPITVIFTIPEDNLDQVAPQLRKGTRLTVDAYDRTAQTKLAGGYLLTIDNQIDTTTGTVKGRAIFANNENALFPNQFVNTRLLVKTLRGVTLVPSSAIQQNGQASFVYVIQGNFAHMRSVKVGVTEANQTQVDGINPGDVLANSSFDKLQDNAPVTVSNTAPTGGAGRTGNKNSGGDTTGATAPTGTSGPAGNSSTGGGGTP
jgi:membrane fusion protein, multidrug efflux system